MQIHHKGMPTQNVPIKVTCLDSIMVEMLSCAPDHHAVYHNTVTMREPNYGSLKKPIYKFITGADLYCDINKNEFEIYHNVSNGNAAVAELKMLDALRLAKKHYGDMKTNNYNKSIELFQLRVTHKAPIPLSNSFNHI